MQCTALFYTDNYHATTISSLLPRPLLSGVATAIQVCRQEASVNKLHHCFLERQLLCSEVPLPGGIDLPSNGCMDRADIVPAYSPDRHRFRSVTPCAVVLATR